jgi:hypothetical protein
MTETTRFDWAMSRAAKLYPGVAWQLEYRHDGVVLSVNRWDWSGIALAGAGGADADANTRENKIGWLDKMLDAATLRRSCFQGQPAKGVSRRTRSAR